MPATIASVLLSVAPAGASTGGASATPAPTVRAFTCRVDCPTKATARPGSVVVVRGRDLDGADTVTFAGGPAPGDEASVEPERVSRTWVTVRVPRSAVTGPVVVVNDEGVASAPSRRSLRIRRGQLKSRAVSSGPIGLEVAITGQKVFFDAERLPTVTFTVSNSAPVHVVVQVVRVVDGVVVAAFDQGSVPAGEPRTVTWDGLAGGVAAADGRYEFRVLADDGNGATATSAQAAPEDAPASPESFLLVGHKFPVRGRHDFGGFAATFGGGRGHQGQDVFAACGTPLVAARGGVVKINRFQERAGYYVVIDGEQTDVDYVYMHMREASPLAKGARVRTGQIVGSVGDTGHADGCHLHFEVWTGPGWYTGGSAFDPLPLLKDWDRFS